MPRDDEPEIVDREEPDLDEPEVSDLDEGGAGDKGKDKGKEGKGGKGKQPDEVRDLRRQLAAERKRREELETSERYWADQARSGGKSADEEDEPNEPAEILDEDDGQDTGDDTADKLTDELSTQGLAALLKRGVMTERTLKQYLKRYDEAKRREMVREIRQAVAAERQKITADAQLVADFPELQKDGSELRTAVAGRLKALRDRSGNPKWTPSDSEFRLLVENEQLKLKVQGNGKHRRRDDEDFEDEGLDREDERERDDEDDEDRDRDRRRRVRAQDGPRSRRGGDFDEDYGTSPLVKDLLRNLQVSEEDFEKSRESMNGGSRRRRR
jgi:hypothetical protein